MSEALFQKPITRKLVGIVKINYVLETKTGLIIRAPLAKMTIGGADQQPMSLRLEYPKPETNETIEVEVPYIPGSSIKGRMRSLLELYTGSQLYFDGKVFMHVRDIAKNRCKDIRHSIDNLFGSPAIQLSRLREDYSRQPTQELKNLARDIEELYAQTRLIVKDSYPTVEYVSRLLRSKPFITFDDFLEEKSENRIDRITSAADPRTLYRVRPGVEFSGEIDIVLFDVDVDPDKLGAVEEYLRLVATGLKLIEDTYLGGCGSRGYGKVVFRDISIKLYTKEYYDTGDENKIIDINKEVGKINNVEEFLKKVPEIASIIASELRKHL